MHLTVFSKPGHLVRRQFNSWFLSGIKIFVMAACLQLSVQGYSQERPGAGANAGAPHEVSGTVVDEGGTLLPGISVVVKGTTRGTTTNSSGRYSIAGVDDNATLVFTGINIGKYEVKVNGRSKLSISVKQKSSELEEVVINKGYYTQSRLTNVGSVSTLSAREIEKQPVNNILDALIGRINGLSIYPTTGVAGTAPPILIRGRSGFGTLASSTSANPPLFILDGVPLPPNLLVSNGSTGYLNNLLGLNPMDVESVSVLKDADATAIYGSRGSNGIILITTKHGRGSAVKVNVNASTGFQKVGHFIDLLSNEQYRAMRREAFAKDGITPTGGPTGNAPDLLDWDSTKVHDWQKELIGGTAHFSDINLSVSGGSENIHFYVSSAYHTEGSVMPGNFKFSRGSFNGSVNYLSNNRKLSMDLQTGYGVSNINLSKTDLTSFITYAPNYPVFDSLGKLDWSGNSGNPYAYTKQKYALPAQNYLGTIQVGYEVLNGLKLSFRAGYNTSVSNTSWQQPLSTLNPADVSNYTAKLVIQNSTNSNWIIEPFAEYRHNINKHHFNLLAGGTFDKQSQNGLYLSGSGFANEHQIGDIGSATSVNPPSYTQNPYAYASFYSRLGYDFSEKYLGNITYRRDGSNRFGGNNKFGSFGAVGLGWVFSNERFVRKMFPFISYGKLRTSYGATGNDNLPTYGYIQYYNAGTQYNGTALVPGNLSNPDLKWEVTKKFEVAVELGVLNNRISFTGAYYRNRNTDGLIYYVIAPQLPFNYFISNYPSLVQNQGLEIDLSTRNLTGKFTWNTMLNVSRTAGKLIRFENFTNSAYSVSYQIGKSMTIIRTNESHGLDSAGLPLIVSTLPTNRLYAGNNDPFFGSMTNEFGYKGFNLSFLIQFNKTRGVPNYLPDYTGYINKNTTTYSLGRWQNPGDELHTNIPRFTTVGSFSTYNGSTENIATSNIFRLSNISLAYTIPAKVTRKLKLGNMRIYCNGQNIYVFDKYRKYRLDPLTGNGTLPPLRTIIFGINASF